MRAYISESEHLTGHTIEGSGYSNEGFYFILSGNAWAYFRTSQQYDQPAEVLLETDAMSALAELYWDTKIKTGIATEAELKAIQEKEDKKRQEQSDLRDRIQYEELKRRFEKK